MKLMMKAATTTMAALALAAGLAIAPATASASEVGALGCGASYLNYYYEANGSTKVWSKNCSGQWPMNSFGVKLVTNGWSGYVRFSDSSKTYFCDWETIYLHMKPKVVEIFMAANKAAWCQ